MTTSTPRLAAEHIVKRFGPATVLDDVHVQVHPGEIVGLIGENGAGKSTLLDVLSGVHQPDAGTIQAAGESVRFGSPALAARLGIYRVFQEQSVLGRLPVYLNLCLGAEEHFSVLGMMVRSKARAHARRVLAEVGLDFDEASLAGNYTFGQRQLLEIARAVSLSRIYGSPNPVILLDEPTAALSGAELELFFALMHRLRTEGASFVFVTHRLPELLEHCDRLYVLKDGVVVTETGPDVGEAELHRLMVGRERADDMYHKQRQSDSVGEVRLRVVDLATETTAPVSFSVSAGEIVGFGGLLGSGKNELAAALFGALDSTGTVELDGTVLGRGVRSRVASRVGFIPLHRHAEGINLGQTVVENVNAVQTGRGSGVALRSRADERKRAQSWQHQLGIRAQSLDQRARTLSGGNQQKVVFAKWLSSGVDVLIADNPTRGVDAGAKEEIYSLLRDLSDQGVAIVLISDDLPELIGLSHRLIIMSDGQVTGSIDSPRSAPAREEDVVALMV